jgi:hypothetical protein
VSYGNLNEPFPAFSLYSYSFKIIPMTHTCIAVTLFLILLITTLLSNGVQAYIHYEAYPLIPLVGKTEFAGYLKEYERRLTVPLVLPYLLTLLSNLALLFIRPAGISLCLVITAFVLNLAVAIATLTLATPVYNRIKQKGAALPEDMVALMRINLLRLVLSTVSSAVVVYMLAVLLPK